MIAALGNLLEGVVDYAGLFPPARLEMDLAVKMFAKDRDFDKLVLFSPFASRYDMARKAFGFAPQKLVLHGNSYNSAENIKNIDEATLIIHGNTDIVVPFEQ